MDTTKTDKGSVAIDFDGVINSYRSGFVAIDNIPDPPVDGVLVGIMKYIDHGFKVYIFSTRNNQPSGTAAIFDWLRKHGMPETHMRKLNVVSGKPIAKLYIDDRAYQFTGKLPSVEYIENFKPWHGGHSSSQK